MTTFYAQPYDIKANGFYFDEAKTFQGKCHAAKNSYGDPVEEFEIQFIDGELIDCEVCEAIGINQANIVTVLTKLEEWNEEEKINLVIAVGECGYSFDLKTGDPDDFDIQIYHAETMRDLAEQFVDEGLFGDIPEYIAPYVDYHAIARDLAMDYTATTINGDRLIYRCD